MGNRDARTKQCPRCGENKAAGCFGVNQARPDGLGRCCKTCTSERAQENYRKRITAQGKTVRERIPLPEGAEGCKRCPDCGEVKLHEEFRKNKARPDGLAFYCKSCFKRRDRLGHKDRAERAGRTVRERVETPAGSKWCPSCKEIKPHEKWDRNNRTSDGYCSHCKACKAERSARDYLKRTYGLTTEELRSMIAAQGGVCVICKVRPAEHVDHDHETGKVREVLCFTCNVMLGQAQDDPTLLMRAIAYLQKHNEEAALPGLPEWVLESRRGFMLGA